MTTPVVVFPDVELWATGYLRAALTAQGETDVFVGNVEPSNAFGRRVIVRRDGGRASRPMLDTARLGVRVLATSEKQANDLAALVRALLAGSANHGPVRHYTDVSGPSAISDPSGPMRYFVCELTVRGSAL